VQDDRKRLLEMFDGKQREVQIMTAAYNHMVDANTHLQSSLAYTEAQLERERTRSALERWLERIVFIGGVVLLRAIP
jgi:hypothetical protein